MLSLQRFHDRLSALVIGARENSADVAGRMVSRLSLTTKRSSMLFGVVFPMKLVLAAGISAACSDAFVSTLEHGLGMIISILMGLGVAIAVIGIVVGGLMRATAWGSEQRIAMSNKAITCAVIGLVIVLVGVTLGAQIPNWFSGTGGSCSDYGS
jgi:hypothetical protein